MANLATDATTANQKTTHKHTRADIEKLFDLPLMDLLLQAQTIHRENFKANEVQISTLLSIKTGNCPEDCGYCSQSGHHRDTTKLQAEKRIEVDKVIAAAKRAKNSGSSRFCMGAAWKHPSAKDMPYVVELIKEVKALGLETCMTLGMLDTNQATQLADAGLDYYNHNLDTSRSYYEQVVSTARKMALNERIIIQGGCWDYLNAVFNRAGVTRDTVHKGIYGQGPYASSGEIEVGDWLYYINHGYNDVEHSGLFVGWVDERAKQALILSYAGENRPNLPVTAFMT